jgi:hypothetical protein
MLRRSTVRETAAGIGDDVDRLRHALVEAVRTSTADVDRRTEPRHTTSLSATLLAGGQSHPVQLDNISAGGAAVTGGPSLREGTEATLVIPGLRRRLTGRVQAESSGRLRLRFTQDVSSAEVEALFARAA